MTTANSQQRQFTLFRKLSTEVRPPPLVRRDERIRSMNCSFEEIAESEEEDIQIQERSSPEGRSPFAVAESPFTELRGSSLRNSSPIYAKRLKTPRLCRGFSDPGPRRRQMPTMLGSLSPDRHEIVSDLLTLPPIPEAAASSVDCKDDCSEV